MPDISMCANITCPVRNTCYRFKVTPNEHRQTFSAFKVEDKNGCSHYVQTNKPEGIKWTPKSTAPLSTQKDSNKS